MGLLVNDVHSQLNATMVQGIERPQSLAELQALIRRARAEGLKLSVAGARHAMGGQQFTKDSLHVDMRGLRRVLGVDADQGLLHIEAGADWPTIIAATQSLADSPGGGWGIRQKQTGVDEVTLGGSISANAHGRGLLMGPLADDIEDLTLVDADAQIQFCSREQNAELFSLVIGGYGLFGIIYSASLRLSRRRYLKRVVNIIDIDDAVTAVYRRVQEGCLYGDFQFAIDAGDENFLRRGVLACYQPVDSGAVGVAEKSPPVDLAPEAWLHLLRLAYKDKKAAFRLYAQHYVSTDGQYYWSDTMQLSTYIPSYAEYLQQQLHDKAGDGETIRETLMIGEHYVPRDQLLAFMHRARGILRELGTEIIYGTIRAIRRDELSFLPWAKADYACVIFNLRTPHHEAGIARTRATFRALIDASLQLNGSFFLTYHRYATARQVAQAYPRFREFLALKKRYDTQELFSSDWYRHYRNLFAAEPV